MNHPDTNRRDPAHPLATLHMKSGAQIVLSLCPEAAPNTVASFLYLARRGCFDNHAIERIAPGFVADMSFTAYGREDARYLIAYETRDAGFPNPLPAEPGTVVMGGYEQGIAGGEFFFPFVRKEHILWSYPAFGRVVSGMDEILRWNTLPVHEMPVPGDPSVTVTVPDEPPVIERVTVETFGVDYGEPVRLEGVPLPGNWA